MKRILIFTLAVVAVLSLTACSSYGSYSDGYAEGYADGLYDGYLQGTCEAPEIIEGIVELYLKDIEDGIKARYGIDSRHAMQTIENYAIGEPIPEEDLQNAIWAMSKFYVETAEIIFEISEYEID